MYYIGLRGSHKPVSVRASFSGARHFDHSLADHSLAGVLNTDQTYARLTRTAARTTRHHPLRVSSATNGPQDGACDGRCRLAARPVVQTAQDGNREGNKHAYAQGRSHDISGDGDAQGVFDRLMD